MTREQALNYLKSSGFSKEQIQAIVEALSGVDAISRAEMLKYQQYLHGKMSNEENHKLWEFIQDLPSVTPRLSSELEKNSKKLEKDFGELDYIKGVIKQAKIEVLTDLQLEVEKQCKIPNNCASAYDWNNGVYACYKAVQQKIDALKAKSEPQESEDNK